MDIITAGYPCQPFSIAGRKQAEQDPRHLWPYIRDIMADLQPRIAFFENVAHHLRLGFEQVHDDLRGLGYGVKAGLFTAEEVGASHKRERLFILAHRESVFGEWCFPEGSFEQSKVPAGGQHSNVAHAAGTGAWLDQSWLSERIVRNSASMVNATRQRDQRTSGYFPETHGRPDGQCLRIPDNTGDDLADPFKPGLERFPRHEETRDRANLTCGNGLPPWPPGPRNIEAWGSVPAALKPAVHRMADGMADRVDRIRLCGNGVVPLAAAYAFRTLASFIEG
ncbi:MAG: DNA cytosine methyltransferase [Bdellovibrionales bacterium]